jgi:hypothetical protein
MDWKKLGQIFNVSGQYDWMNTHAANPVPFILDEVDEVVRVFFTSRTRQNISYIGYVDIDFKRNFKILDISKQPVISPGGPGLFDDSGAAMGQIIEHDNKYFLFYLGWNLKVTVPWLNTIGLAISESINGPFQKVSLAPVMDRSDEDPFSISYPSILKDGNIFKMWYGSNLSWGVNQKEMQHVIKYAESADLTNWVRTNQIHVPLIHPNEYALSKPWVRIKDNKFQMWYSFRGNRDVTSYRIGFADSIDGSRWIRKDELSGIDVSASGWDSEMICYPSVFEMNGNTYMLYNGNGYGKSGFGIAILI